MAMSLYSIPAIRELCTGGLTHLALIRPFSTHSGRLSNGPIYPIGRRLQISADSCYTGFIMADDQNPQIPVTLPDQSASSDTNRPDSTIMADPSQSATIDDRPISTNLADPTNPTSDAPAVPIEPVSTISADSTVPSSPEQSTNTDNRPEPTIPADLSAEAQTQADSSPISVSPAEPSVEEAPPTPVPAEASVDQTATPSPTLPSSPTIDSPVVSTDISAPSDLNPLPINVSPPEIKPIEVQSDVPESTSAVNTSQQPTESAKIKTEPPESLQNAPLADSSPANSTPTTFGDLIQSENQPPSIPPTPPIPSTTFPDLSSLSTPSDLPSSNNSQPITQNPQQSSSFSDLIKDIKPEESVIQPPPVLSEPTVSSIPTPPSITNNPTPTPSSPPSPISPSSDASSRRQKAILVRKQKHDTNLAKILELLSKKGKVKNIDVRDYLRVSQSTVSDYLHILVSSGKIKKEGKGKATYYTI